VAEIAGSRPPPSSCLVQHQTDLLYSNSGIPKKHPILPVDTHSFRRLPGAVDFQEQGCNIIFIGRIAILPAHLILFSPF